MKELAELITIVWATGFGLWLTKLVYLEIRYGEIYK